MINKDLLAKELIQLTIKDFEEGRVDATLHMMLCDRIYKSYPKLDFIGAYIEELKTKHKENKNETRLSKGKYK